MTVRKKEETPNKLEGPESGLDNKSNMKDVFLATFPNTQKRVEKATRSGVLLTNFELFGNVVKHCLEFLIKLLN